MMFEGALFFILGIAFMAFILILIVPFIWRRMLFFTGKIMRSKMPFSIEEVQADKRFLQAQHAVQLARQEERCKLLQKINDEQKLQLHRNTEHLLRLQELEENNNNISEELISYKNNLKDESNKIENVFRAQSVNAKEVKDLYFAEKLVRVDIASYEESIKLMDKKISLLMEKYNQLNKMLNNENSNKTSIC